LDLGALAARHEDRLLEADRPHCAHRGGDAAGGALERAPIKLRRRAQSHVARSFVQYETMRSAPARLIAVSASSAAVCSSSQPCAAAALTIAYSPETLYAASGRSKRSRAARITSRYGRAGLIISMSAPSATSSSHSRSASRTFAGSIWYPRRSPNDGADSAASRNDP